MANTQEQHYNKQHVTHWVADTLIAEAINIASGTTPAPSTGKSRQYTPPEINSSTYEKLSKINPESQKHIIELCKEIAAFLESDKEAEFDVTTKNLLTADPPNLLNFIKAVDDSVQKAKSTNKQLEKKYTDLKVHTHFPGRRGCSNTLQKTLSTEHASDHHELTDPFEKYVKFLMLRLEQIDVVAEFKAFRKSRKHAAKVSPKATAAGGSQVAPAATAAPSSNKA